MDNVRVLRYDWYTGMPAFGSVGDFLARQYDHLSDMVVLAHAPKLNNYYLIVTMKETENGDVKTLEPIQLSGSYWLIPNIYTQLAQDISFQFCCKTENGDFESHSAQIRGRILPSKDHNGAAIDVDPSVMFDPYKQWVSELAMAAGAIVIDSELDDASTNPVQNKAVKAAIGEVNERLKSRIQVCENELGIRPEIEYILPERYKTANYESSNGLRKVKYENGKFVFYNKNTTVGSVSGTELTTSAFGPAVSQDLVIDVRTFDHLMLSFDYENTYSSEITPTLNLRLYDSELTGSRPLYVYIPVGSGHINADISKEIEDSNINTETYPMLLIRAIGMGEHTAAGEEVLLTTIDGFYEPVVTTALSSRVSTNETNIAKNSEDINTLSGDVDSLSESVSANETNIAKNSEDINAVSGDVDSLSEQIGSVTSRIQACENELGTHPEVEYVLPVGYKSANYESSNGLRKVKYENGKFVFCNKNRTIGSVAGTELNTSAFGPTVSQDLVLDVRTVGHIMLSFDYENTYSAEITPTLNLRMYDAGLSGSRPMYVYIPVGSGHIDADISREIEGSNINTKTYPMLMIRAIGMGEHTATGEEVLTTTIEGFYEPVASTALSDRVSANETNIAKNIEDIDILSGNVDSLSENVSGYDGRIASNTQSIEDVKSELGLDYTYTIPEGYKSANYESSNGLRKVKYENGKFVFCNKNRTIGSVAGTELNTSAFGPTVSQDLVFDVRTVVHPVLSFDYENTYSSEITPTLNLRMYNAELTGAKPIYVYIPIGSGHIDVDILKEIEDNNINTETHPMLLIRAIGMGEHTATGEEVLSTTIDGFYDDEGSILNTVASLAEDIESVKEHSTNKTSSTFQNPFRFNKPYWAHFFLNTVNDADIYVPSQSLYDIQISKRMGFDVIEANVHTLSDGTAICLHGDNFKFGVEFESADGVTDVQNTVIANVDYEWVKTNVRYKAKFPKLRVCPPTLEEFLLECKKYRMIPYMNFRDPSHIELADKIMGLENYVLYGDGRAARRYSNAMVASWANLTTKQQIVDWVEKVGNPCMVGCMHPENFTAEEWVDIIETVHQMGAVIAWSEYNSPSDWLKLIEYGMDMTGATYGLNPTERGNLQNFSSALGFSDYTVIDGAETPGQLTMQNGGTVALANTIGSAKFLTGMWLDVTFIGSISVSMGRFITHANCQSTSTKSKTIRLSTYFMNAIPNFEVKALSAGTIIENIDCKVSEF